MSDSLEAPAEKLEGETRAEEVEEKLEENRSLRDQLVEQFKDEDEQESEEASADSETAADSGDEQTADDQAGADGESAEGSAEDEETEEKLVAPEHWAQNDQVFFNEQTPEIQKWIMGRYNDMEGAYKQRVETLKPLQGVVDKWNPYFQQRGVVPDQVVNNLVEIEYVLQTGTQQQKLDILGNIMRTYGISMPEQGAQPGESLEDGDLTVQQALKPIMEELSGLKTQLQTRQEADKTAQVATVERQVEEFRNRKTETGDLVHPFFDEVFEDMVRLNNLEVQAGNPLDIAKLYERAVWLNDTVRQKLLDAQKETVTKEDLAERQAKAKKAKAAASSITGEASGATVEPTSVREHIEQAFKQA